MIKAKIESLLKRVARKKLVDIEVFPPDNEKFGHYSTNAALKLARVLKKNPLVVAEEIVKKINLIPHYSLLISRVEIAPPGFINFWLREGVIAAELKQVLKTKNKYGQSQIGKGKTVIIDYSAPNIAKPMHVGHLRSAIIGQTLYNLFRFLGYKVIGDDHLGDWGTQFGALIVAYKKWFNKKEFNKNPIEHLVKLYVKFHKESEKHDWLLPLAREETKKLQEGDGENRKIWRLFTKESLKEFHKIYKRLGIKHDITLGESFYQPMLNQIIKEALRKKIEKRRGSGKNFLLQSLAADGYSKIR